jgi:benzoate-CoA ligase
MEAAAVGVPVDGLIRVKAFVVLHDGYQGSEELVEELQTWCKENLKRYQYPHIVEFIEELPKTVTGKIQRFKLRGQETAGNMPQDDAGIPQKDREAPRQEDELV